MEFRFNDGGRSVAGYKGKAGDCVTRAIAITTGKPYQEVYDALRNGLKAYACNHRDRTAKRISRKGTTPRSGVSKKVFGRYLESLGWKWTPTMQIGQGCKVHLRADELPRGRLLVSVSKHLTAVIDGIIHDTYDPSRDGTRCVYGYYINPRLAQSLTTSEKCQNPLCSKTIEPLQRGWRRTQRRFCSNRCKIDGWVIRRTSEILKQVGMVKFLEILETEKAEQKTVKTIAERMISAGAAEQ
jgi:hypothetical protein